MSGLRSTFVCVTRRSPQYEEHAAQYFGKAAGLEAQLVYLVTEGSKARDALISLKFALCVYVRAVYQFYMDEISDALLDKLCHIRRTLTEITPDAAAQVNGHPWQLIYKYLAFIAYCKGRNAVASEYMRASNTILEDCDDIIKVIIHYGNAEYAELTGDVVARDEESRRAWAEILEISEEVKAQDCAEAGRLYDYLNGLITYTYR